MKNTTKTVAEVVAIIDTYEGMIRQGGGAEVFAEWTKWKAALCRMVGR